MVDSQTAVPVNTVLPATIAKSVDQVNLASVTECAIGSKINAFYITTEIVATEAGAGKTPNFYWYLWKNPANNLTAPTPNAVGSDPNKRYVIHQEMVMFQANALDDGVPRNVFKGVIVVPKGMRRMGPEDEWEIVVFIPSTGVAVNSCSQTHYKEFR